MIPLNKGTYQARVSPEVGNVSMKWGSSGTKIATNKGNLGSEFRGEQYYRILTLFVGVIRIIITQFMLMSYDVLSESHSRIFYKNGVFGFQMRSHSESRKKVCALCWNRRGKNVQKVIREGSSVEKAMQEFVDEHYKATDEHTPCLVFPLC